MTKAEFAEFNSEMNRLKKHQVEKLYKHIEGSWSYIFGQGCTKRKDVALIRTSFLNILLVFGSSRP